MTQFPSPHPARCSQCGSTKGWLSVDKSNRWLCTRCHKSVAHVVVGDPRTVELLNSIPVLTNDEMRVLFLTQFLNGEDA